MDKISSILGFDRKLTATVAPFDVLPSKKVDMGSNPSMYAPSGSTRSNQAVISPTLLRALLAYFDMEDGKEVGAVGSVAFTSVAEFHSTKDDSIDIAVYFPEEGTVQAVRYQPDTATSSPYVLKKEEKDGTAIMLAMLPTLLSDPEFASCVDSLREERKKSWADMNAAAFNIGKASQNLYYRLKDDSLSSFVEFNIPASGNILVLKNASLIAGTYDPDEVIAGKFSVLGGSSAPKATKTSRKTKKSIALEDLVSKFPLDSSRVLTPEEKALVPHLEDWYIVPDFVMDVCQTVQGTAYTSFPMNNFTFRGGAGSGKSKATEAIAAGFGLPHVFFTCSSNTEIFDFVGQVMPAGSKSKDPEVQKTMSKFEKLGGINCRNIAKVYGLPSLEDATFMPDEIYEELTGGDSLDEKLSAEEKVATCCRKWHEIMSQKVDALMEVLSVGDDNKFVYTETNFIKAIKNGWVVEIQEPNVISSPGVLVGLNGLLQEGSVTLPTGEVVTRHPDTVVIFTTNTSYQGCRAMNQSVLDRSNECFDIDTPSLDSMVERVVAITEYDEEIVTEMASIVKDIEVTMNEQGIDDGTCGMRSLLSWAMKAKITGDPYKAAFTTVLNKCSSDKDAREGLQKRLDESSFKVSKRTRTR